MVESNARRPRATAVRLSGHWRGDVRDAVVLGYDDRHRRRLAMCGVRGLVFVLDLPEAVTLRGGDALVLEDGGLVEVVAAPEPLVEISGRDEAATIRIAWHLGNRHLAVQLVGRRLRIRRDHVIEAMAQGLGGTLRAIEAPFDPEGGAYAGEHVHGGGVVTHTGMNDALARLKLLAWLSPSFPVGSFAFSGGLEWAVEAGDIVDAHGLAGWLDDLLRHGAPCTDAVMLAAAWHQPADLVELNGLALALTSSSERRLELAAQGTAFLVAVVAAWPAAGLQQLSKLPEVAYPIAVGCTAAAHAVPLLPTLEAFLLASIANMVSAALRLGVVGQSEAQTLIAKAAPATARLARWAETTTLDDLGGCAWRAEIASMRHETQYSRLFRS